MADGGHGKKRKRKDIPPQEEVKERKSLVDTSKPTAIYTPTAGRRWTVSIALPGSVIANAQSHDLKTSLAGQIARALAVFSVDEVVIFDDGTPVQPTEARLRHLNERQQQMALDSESNGYTAFSNPNQFLYHVLSYLETPPYMRKDLFSFHPNLRTAGSLPSLDMPHHLRADEWCVYREGITLATDKPHQNGLGSSGKHRNNNAKINETKHRQTFVATGLQNPVTIPVEIPPNTRVTLKFDNTKRPDTTGATLTAKAVPPEAPRYEGGYYWGYSVRAATSLEAVFTESPYDGGYDYCVGTSERGTKVQDLTKLDSGATASWQHLLICFGGVAGLEKALENDKALRAQGVEHVENLFDAWVNLVSGQGSRTIRTEEAIWIGLMGLREFVEQSHE